MTGEQVRWIREVARWVEWVRCVGVFGLGRVTRVAGVAGVTRLAGVTRAARLAGVTGVASVLITD